MTRILFLAIVSLFTINCATSRQTLAAQAGDSVYIPLDPLPIETSEQCADWLAQLPDQTSRIAIAEADAEGGLSFGVGSVGVKGKSYVVTIDYVISDTITVKFFARRKVTDLPTNWLGRDVITRGWELKAPVDLFERAPEGVVTQFEVALGGGSERVSYRPLGAEADVEAKYDYKELQLPVYVGVGLRVTARITVLKGEAKLNGLGAIAADVAAGVTQGSLIVQSLGVSGETTTTTIPLPAELDRTTVQNAVMSLGALKAMLYSNQKDNEQTRKLRVTPRVVGFYNPIGGGKTFVNGVIQQLATQRPKWSPSGCAVKKPKE